MVKTQFNAEDSATPQMTTTVNTIINVNAKKSGYSAIQFKRANVLGEEVFNTVITERVEKVAPSFANRGSSHYVFKQHIPANNEGT